MKTFKINQLYFYIIIVFNLCFIGISNAQIKVSGIVTDNTNLPIIGASVVEIATDNGVVTDESGKYEISLSDNGGVIEFSFIGYTTVTRTINNKTGASQTINIKLVTDSVALGEVVVTGTFRVRSERESPISMTTLSAEKIQSFAATGSQADILRTVPGITAEGGGGEVASNIFVRGMPSGGQYQFTPLQVDGLPVLATFGLNSSAHDVYFRNDIGVSNLEFIRGGASTLFGAGSVAGIINYTSFVGSENPINKVQLEYANGGRAKFDFLTSGAISENLFFSMSGFYRYDEGPIDTGLATRGYQLRGNIKRLFNNKKSSFVASGQIINDAVQFYLPYPLDNSGSTIKRPTGNDGKSVYQLLTSQINNYEFDTPNGHYTSSIRDGVITKGGYAMFDLKHSFGDGWILSSKAKYSKYDHWFNLFLDGDGINNTPETQADYITNKLKADTNKDTINNDNGVIDGTAKFTYSDTGETLGADDLLFQNRYLDRQRPLDELIGEINFSKDFGRHLVTVGTFLTNSRAEDNNWLINYLGDFRNSPRLVNVTYDSNNGTGSTGVVYSNNGFINGNQTSNKEISSTKSAFYIVDQYQGEKFNIDFGFRWERAAGTITREKSIGSNIFQNANTSASDWALSIATLYKLNSNSNIYANFSKGYFFPELRGLKFVKNQQGVEKNGELQKYEPEQILQGEVGYKYGTSNLSLTGAVFMVNLNDRLTVDFENDGQGNIVEFGYKQSTQTIGTEINANWQITKPIGLYGNLTYQAHQITKNEKSADYVGNSLRRQPNMMGMFGINFMKSGIDADFSGNYMGDKFSDDGNKNKLDAFTMFRLNLGYTFNLGEKEKLRIGASIFNMFDSQGITEGSPRQANSQTGTGSYFVGRPVLPRRFFFKVSFDF